jgi:hypothetical protein
MFHYSTMFLPKTKRISQDSFRRPTQTLTDTLQTEEKALKRLQSYSKVNNISDVPMGTHIRYITWKNGGERFCLGGWLRKIHDQYVVLATDKLSWSVQRFHYNNKKKLMFTTIFFAKQSKLEQCEHALQQQYLEIQELKKQNVLLIKHIQNK